MIVEINGQGREVPDGLNVSALIAHLGMNPQRVALERNREILPRTLWKETQVQASDSFEIVHMVGGG